MSAKTAALLGALLAIAGCRESSSPDPRIEGPAGKLHFDDGGAGAMPVVFVHGFGGSSQQWNAQLAYLRPTTRAVALDLRGHGKSDAPKDLDYSVASLARDIDAVADKLDLDRFVLVGHSMGGAAALEYARTRPDRVAGLMLVTAPTKASPEMSRKILSAVEADFEKTYEEFWTRLGANATPKTTKQIAKDRKRIERDAALAMMRSIFLYDPTAALATYRGPTLIVDTADHGAGSLHDLAPAVPYMTVVGTSHWPQMDKPEQINVMLDGLLELARRDALRAAPVSQR